MSAILIAIYIVAMVVANILVFWFGPWWSPINAFFLIGLDLTLRDVMQERLRWWELLLVIFAGTLITLTLNPAINAIAWASSAAFLASACVDWLVYSMLKDREWLVKANVSNAAGAVVDSILFPTLAFGVFMPDIIALQFLCKVAGGFMWAGFVSILRRQTARTRLMKQYAGAVDDWRDWQDIDRKAQSTQRPRGEG